MTTLRIYKAPSGQWSGQLLDDDGVEVAGVAGCETPEDVEGAAQDAGLEYSEAIYEEMTREEMERIHSAYFKTFGAHFSHPPLDFGIHAMPLDDLYGHAKAAIASGKPIDWHEILGPTLRERDPRLVS